MLTVSPESNLTEPSGLRLSKLVFCNSSSCDKIVKYIEGNKKANNEFFCPFVHQQV